MNDKVTDMAASANKPGESILPSIDEFMNQQGRRPRILVVPVNIGLQAENSQDPGAQGNGAKIIATAFADLGFDVDLSPNCRNGWGNGCGNSKEIVHQAIENDVHVISLSIQIAAGADDYNVLPCVSELITELKTQDADDILVVTSGDILDEDHKAIEQIGVAVSLRPDTQMLVAVKQLLAAIVSDD